MWKEQDLKKLVNDKLKDYRFVIASNRQPYVHTYNKGKIECKRGVGGVISALDPVMKACQGLWIAHGNGNADRMATDKEGRIQVPPEQGRYTLRRVWLTKEEEQGYYYGFSNEALWPLNHMAFIRPVFRSEDWEWYKQVNRKFAKLILEEINGQKAFVWIQDYHLCLLPKYLKEMAPNQVITAHFWHIPWAQYETFRICPQKTELLEGLLANDLLGFQIRYHCNNFVDDVDRAVFIFRHRHKPVGAPCRYAVLHDNDMPAQFVRVRRFVTVLQRPVRDRRCEPGQELLSDLVGNAG